MNSSLQPPKHSRQGRPGSLLPVLVILVAMLILATAGVALTESSQDTPADPPAGQAPEASVPEQRVHIVIDRFREVGGVVVSEDDAKISIRREGRLETFDVNKVLAIIPLMDVSPEGQPGAVYLRDGSTMEAKILEDAYGEVIVEVEGIRHEIPRSDVDHIVLFPGFDEWLAHVRGKIRPDDLEARIDLAKWMAENKRLDLARIELLEIISIDEHPEAKQLLTLYDARMALASEGSNAPAPRAPKVDRMAGLPRRSLTEQDVNIIRVYEIDFGAPPKVSVPKSTMTKLIAQYAANPLIPDDIRSRERLFSMPEIDKVKLIFDVKARELYPEIKVESMPASLAQFRTNVHNAWLIRNCATSGCHGGQNAGRFFLHRIDSKDTRTILENLLILERLRLGGPQRLVDYENPDRSLLIQYALPPSEARTPHPEVPGYKPVFPSGESRMKSETLNWINSMYQPRPKYPVDFEPPSQKERIQADPPPRVPR